MPAFADRLKDYLDKLNGLRQRGASEDSIRDAFLLFVRQAFPKLELAEPIQLERHIPAAKVRAGYADVLYGDLIFECKRRLDDASRADGKEELTRYIGNQKHPERYFGILTDGESLEVYALRDENLADVDQLRLSVPESARCQTWLDCYLFHEKSLPPTADDVALRFGEHSPTFLSSFRILQGLWRDLAGDAGAQTKFAEWQSLLSIVYGSAVGDESLFLRHTYLALFARVLAFVALEHRAPKSDELTGIVSGATFVRMGFENFIEDDFFAWVSTPAASRGRQPPVVRVTQDLLHSIATRLTVSYDLAAIREDLLKELYQELVDPQTRHDLGEFYTPDWLAELTLEKAGFPPAGQAPRGDGGEACSLLDPSCGSGTFLFTAVRRLRDAGLKGKRLVQFCTEHLAGLDVHPLAVTIAKTNLVLALGKDAVGGQKSITLPIYMADTLSSVKPAMRENVVPVPVEVDAISKRANKQKPRGLPAVFDLPAVLAVKPDVLYEALEALLESAEPNVSQADAVDGLRKRLETLGLQQNHVWYSNLLLMRWLLSPPATDSVWRFVLRNAYQPELLARRKFTFVVGNPPWLSYRYIKRTDYQERVRRLVFEYELLGKKQAHLFTQMELATLFFAFCADRYLADNGTLAFVMPRSVLTGAKQHAAFRENYVAGSSCIIDCERVSPLFNVPACVVIRSKRDGRRIKAKIPELSVAGQLPSRNLALAKASQHWRSTAGLYQPLTQEAGSPYWADVINGATIFPRCLWFVRPPAIARVIDRRRPQLETDQETERQAKAPWKGIRLNGSVEADYLFATLLCDQMLPFGRRKDYLAVLPVKELKSQEPLLLSASDAVRSGHAGLADWLRKAEQQWEKHRKSKVELLDYLNWQGKLTRQRATGVFKVLNNDAGTHVCSCVIDTRDGRAASPYGLPVRGFIAEHVTYWFETEDAAEAHYLCAVLNAPRVDKAIKPYQTRGAFGAQRGKGERHVGRRPFEVLPIPRYDSKDKRHRELARLSERCHAKIAKVVAEADADWLKAPIGRVRTELRKTLLMEELAEIDALVAQILPR